MRMIRVKLTGSSHIVTVPPFSLVTPIFFPFLQFNLLSGMKCWFIFLFLWSISGSTIAQPSSFLHTLCQDSTLDLCVILDWKQLHRTKKDKAYLPASVVCHVSGRDTLRLDAKVRTRGHMRLEICSFPPLKLKLDKDDLEKQHLSGMNEMDIVHHCHESDQYEQLLLREYMVYKLWELVSPLHFKTKLIRLRYMTPEGVEPYPQAYAFMVEDEEELIARLEGRKIKSEIINNGALDRESFLLLCLFEFMVGNTDWYIPTRHNLEFIGIPGRQLLQTIPFDFDYSGLVNAPYAAPHASLELSSVTIRYYQGWCQTEEEVMKQLQVFRDQKENILSLPFQIPGLDEKSIQYTLNYLNDFFEIIENPKKLQNQILRHCDMWPTGK